MTVLCFGAVQLFAPQIVHIFLGDNNAALSDVSVGALRRYGLCYLLVGFNVLMGGFLTAVEQPRSGYLHLHRPGAGAAGRSPAGAGRPVGRRGHLV